MRRELLQHVIRHVLHRVRRSGSLIECLWDERLGKHSHPRFEHRRADGDLVGELHYATVNARTRLGLIRVLGTEAEDPQRPLGAHRQETLDKERHYIGDSEIGMCRLLPFHQRFERHSELLFDTLSGQRR